MPVMTVEPDESKRPRCSVDLLAKQKPLSSKKRSFSDTSSHPIYYLPLAREKRYPEQVYAIRIPLMHYKWLPGT